MFQHVQFGLQCVFASVCYALAPVPASALGIRHSAVREFQSVATQNGEQPTDRPVKNRLTSTQLFSENFLQRRASDGIAADFAIFAKKLTRNRRHQPVFCFE